MDENENPSFGYPVEYRKLVVAAYESGSEIVAAYESGSESMRKVARRHGVGESTLQRWVSQNLKTVDVSMFQR